ncbi:hypothetical protein HAALTHF_44990n [Vreelandella aquamarina]|nr:hypothetical protein HAALTHF_44990n [Halomonas axialensis]
MFKGGMGNIMKQAQEMQEKCSAFKKKWPKLKCTAKRVRAW